MPKGTQVVSAESCGISTWTKTAKISIILPSGEPASYFLKCARGTGARAIIEGEWLSVSTIEALVQGLVPKALGWGQYYDDDAQVFFFLGDFHDMDFSVAPDPARFTAQIAELHRRGTSPTGMFGFSAPTACGKMVRTVSWEKSWAASFTAQLQDVIKYDKRVNEPWPEYDAACKQLIDVVVPRLLGALQSDGREIVPALIHGDLWERNVGIDRETRQIVVFDPGCTYAHNEMEFGTWRCSWAFHFSKPIYMEKYQHHIAPSEPVKEWDDRNKLYSIHPNLNNSAGHPGHVSRETYAPMDGLEKYNPEKDISVTGDRSPFAMKPFHSHFSLTK
ncbi:MAG: hypothetical protein Q9160_007562 [Pyrenula sp. 1 TL-2023]